MINTGVKDRAKLVRIASVKMNRMLLLIVLHVITLKFSFLDCELLTLGNHFNEISDNIDVARAKNIRL